jgi:5-methylthioribose kinase
MLLGSAVETLDENVNLGAKLHWKFENIRKAVDEVLDEIFDEYEPYAGCSKEVRTACIQKLKKLMPVKAKK